MDGMRYMIFIKWVDKLPNHYLQLAFKLKSWGIGILPMDYATFLKHRFDGHKNLLSITCDIESQKNKLNTLQPTLNFAIRRGRFTLYDVSSFSSPNSNAEELKRNYRFFALPAQYDEIAKAIALDIFSQKYDELSWPGGRNSKLPYDVLSN